MKTNKFKLTALFFALLFLNSSFLIKDSGAQWTQINYNLMGKGINAITISGDTLFAGTTNSGISFSTNNGVNWTQIGPSVNVLSILILENIIITGTGGNHTYRSTNRGLNWSQVTFTSAVNAFTVLGNTIFAGTNAGVYLSTNSGINWIQTGLNNREVRCLAISGSNIFAGTSNMFSPYYGVYLSSDNGISWSQTTLNNKNIYALTVSGNNIFAGTYGDYYGVYISTNNGASWAQTSLRTNTYALAAFGDNIFASGSLYSGISGIFLSTNNGSNWVQLVFNQNFYSFGVLGNNIFAGSYYNKGLYTSPDNGTSWIMAPKYVYTIKQSGSNLYTGTDDGVYYSTDGGLKWISKNFCYSAYGYSSLLLDSNYIFVGTSSKGIYYTTNDGANWTQTSLNDKTVNSLVKNDSYILAGTSSYGIYYSTNYGANWTQSSLNSITINDLYIMDSNVYAGTVFGGVYISTNNGVNWSQTSLTYIDVYSLISVGNRLYAGTASNGVYYTTNNGVNWAQTSLTSNKIVSFASYGSSLFAGTESAGVYVTQNGGINWTQSNTGMGNQNVKALSTSGNYIIAGTNGNGFYRRYILEFAPIRGDANLDSLVNVFDINSIVSYILGNNPLPFSFLAADVNTDNLINVLDVVGTVNIILHPGDNIFANKEYPDRTGTAFLSVENNNLKLTNTIPVSGIQFRLSGAGAQNVTFTPSPVLSQFQVASGSKSDTTKTFVIFTLNDTALNNGIHTLGTFSGLNSEILLKDTLIADEFGNGIITGATGNEKSIIPNEYLLNQNYPNPFNPVTVINFQIPAAGLTYLKVYDVTGRLIRTLISEYRQAGYYNVEFDANSLSSGIYFYNLTSGTYSSTKKMMLIK